VVDVGEFLNHPKIIVFLSLDLYLVIIIILCLFALLWLFNCRCLLEIF